MEKMYLFVLMTFLSLHGARAAELPSHALAPGKVQVGSLFGANNFRAMGEIKPSAGGEFLLGLPHNFAAYGDSAWNRVFGYRATFRDGSCESQGIDLCIARASVNLYDLGGGLQWSIPNKTGIVPYFRGGLSWIHLTASAQVRAHSPGMATAIAWPGLSAVASEYIFRGISGCWRMCELSAESTCPG
jgi:hypothetical protein